ncbi:hypothetical protein FGRMN_5737 [Fusarium graminum]|nr:hypothetical protein FGRMN_5737 [Fusarium graminum]
MYSDVMRLNDELDYYKARDHILSSSQKQEHREGQIRRMAQEDFERRIEDRKKAQEEAKEEIEQARLQAEQIAREKLEAERKAEEATRRREEEQKQRMKQQIRLELEAEKQAEEAERKSKARAEEKLEMLIRAKMSETFENFMETATKRLQTMERSGHSQEGDLKSDVEEHGENSNHTGDDKVSCSGRSASRSQPSPVNSPDHSSTTSTYKSDVGALSRNGREWGQDSVSVPEAAPDPPSADYDIEEDAIPDPVHSRRSRKPYSCRDTSSRSRGRTRHRSNASDTLQLSVSSQEYWVPETPDFIQQIAHTVAGILRGATYDGESMTLPPMSPSSPSLPITINKYLEGQPRVSTNKVPLRTERMNASSGVSDGTVSISDEQGINNFLSTQDTEYQNRGRMGFRSSESMTRVNSVASAGATSLKARMSPAPDVMVRPEESQGTTMMGLLVTEVTNNGGRGRIGDGKLQHFTVSSYTCVRSSI